MKEEKHKGDWTYPPYKLGMYIFRIVLIFIVIVILMWFANFIADHTFNCYISNSTYEGRVCEWR